MLDSSVLKNRNINKKKHIDDKGNTDSKGNSGKIININKKIYICIDETDIFVSSQSKGFRPK